MPTARSGARARLGEKVPGSRSQVIAAGSWGAQVVDEINPGGKDVQIIKHRFSAFWDTETDAVLRNLGIKTLFVGGVNMDQCVMTTLEDASFLGYDTVLVEDGTATTSPDYCVQAVLSTSSACSASSPGPRPFSAPSSRREATSRLFRAVRCQSIVAR